MLDDKLLQKSIDKGLEFLQNNQMPHGEFRTYMAPDNGMKSGCKYISTIYTATFILYCLDFLDNPVIAKMKKAALDFIREEMDESGAWRFFGVNRNILFVNGTFKSYTPLGIVPDLDDTACALYCLRENGMDISEDKSMFYNNRNAEGVFNTWLLDIPKHREYTEQTNYLCPSVNDVCCGVNANVLLYLGENEDTLKACDFINSLVEEGREREFIPYFPNEIVLYYLISRAYFNGVKRFGKIKNKISNKLVSQLEDFCSNGNPLLVAFSLCTLLNFGIDDEKMVYACKYLLENQSEGGCWERSGYCTVKIYNFGSDDFTTAICLEAIARMSKKVVSSCED